MASRLNIIPTDGTSSVFDIIQTLSKLEQAAIIRPNNPPPGFGGFLFHLVGDETWEQESDITDHYLEDNTAIQDHWAVHPEKYTVRGIIAEFTDAPTPVSGPIAPQVEPLQLVSPLMPQQSLATTTYATSYAAAKQGQNTKATGAPNQRSLYGLYQNTAGNPPNQRKQTNSFLYWVQMMKGRQLCSVETAWGIDENMAVMVHKAEQPEQTRDQSDFTLTFKKIKFIGSVQVITGQLAGRLAIGNATTTENGNAGQTPVPAAQQQSILYSLSH